MIFIKGFLAIAVSWSLIAIIAVTLIFLLSGGGSPSPAEVFNSHSLALDEGRYDDAEELLEPGCQQGAPEDIRSTIRDFKSMLNLDGFSEVYIVMGTWRHDDGEQAILELRAPAGLPNIQPMVKIDGDWVLSCG